VLQSYPLKEISSRDLKGKEKGREWLRNFTHLLKPRGRHPNKVKETVERRKTQGISDLGWKRKLLHTHYEFQEIPGIPKERTSRLLNTVSLNFVY
jgi:hypothetical protein